MKKYYLPIQKSRKITVENILDIDSAEQPPKGLGSDPQVFRDQILALPDIGNAAMQ